jgi:hypothetical protein
MCVFFPRQNLRARNFLLGTYVFFWVFILQYNVWAIYCKINTRKTHLFLGGNTHTFDYMIKNIYTCQIWPENKKDKCCLPNFNFTHVGFSLLFFFWHKFTQFCLLNNYLMSPYLHIFWPNQMRNDKYAPVPSCPSPPLPTLPPALPLTRLPPSPRRRHQVSLHFNSSLSPC